MSSAAERTDIPAYMQALGRRARSAARALARADAGARDAALTAIADRLEAAAGDLAGANARDLDGARAAGLDAAMLDRLRLDDTAIARMVEGVRQVRQLPDPVGAVSDLAFRPTGIRVGRMRVPIGVIGIIYESRPNVTVDAASLCLKAGNACILRGGSESFHSNMAVAACIRAGLVDAGLDEALVQLVEVVDRAAVGALVSMDEYVDAIVPRGGRALIERVSREATVPVIKHLDGNCHVYVDRAADPDMAREITVNAKCQRYGVCNAMETLLVHAEIAPQVLPDIAAELIGRGVELRGCERTQALLPEATAATEEDWHEEYLGPVLAVRIVDDLDGAMDHIARYGSAHTDAIVTNDFAASQRFLAEVDSASVMVNASTRFADGFEYGLGAEIGVSTNKLHARGPVGLEGLTTQKWIVLGSGQVRE